MTYEHAYLGRGPSDSNSSIHYFGFSVFSVIWGICFSLKANPNGMKRSDSDTLLAQGGGVLISKGDAEGGGEDGEPAPRRSGQGGIGMSGNTAKIE
jgi:hypothetical protein